MGMWSYEGLDKNGKKIKGKLQANNAKEARKLLRVQGVRPKKVIPPSPIGSHPFTFPILI